MPKFNESNNAAVAVHARGTEPDRLVHPLNERSDEIEILAFLMERPVHTVVMAGLIRDNGLESPFNRGTFYACRDSVGRLEGVALVGHATFVEARTEAALRALALLAQKERGAHMILGEQELIYRFWNHYAPAGQTPMVPMNGYSGIRMSSRNDVTSPRVRSNTRR